ncbi:MAG: tRNA (adenosine(37)-N6)-threonylcarbamoyltransferase complex dimerization subunit type 1 TsaB [Okeania sp. SIO2D1]|nr:tRNA (adenosine(37)-N6)-threonylcarbamoyltransferase complex dimerization subunit type 1 TsaB [Okeania sp. SIO2D1]
MSPQTPNSTPQTPQPHYGLALHTTSPQLGLAIGDHAATSTRYRTWDLDREMSTHLHQCITEFLAPQTWSDLAWVAVAKGPGSFTSTRMGVVTARTLAQQLNIPLFAISSLETFAQFVSVSRGLTIPIAVEMTAQRGKLFAGIYQLAPTGILNNILPDNTIKADNWQQILEKLKTEYHLMQTDKYLGNTVASLLELAWCQWQQGKRPHWLEALPFYGQNPV